MAQIVQIPQFPFAGSLLPYFTPLCFLFALTLVAGPHRSILLLLSLPSPLSPHS